MPLDQLASLWPELLANTIGVLLGGIGALAVARVTTVETPSLRLWIASGMRERLPAQSPPMISTARDRDVEGEGRAEPGRRTYTG